MNPQALEKLRAGDASCPSDLDLDQLHQGELLAQGAARISEHVTGCAICTARLASRQAGWAEISDVDPRPLLAGIRRRLDEEQTAPAPRKLWRRFALIAVPVAAAAAVLAIVGIGRRDSSQLPSGDGDNFGVRAKGGVALKVHRFASGRSQQVLSGERFVPGDRLRFVVDLPSAGHINVLGVESSGKLYVAWPIEQGSATLRPAGSDQQLPGAVVLDQSTGRETMYLVHCPQSVGVPSAVCKATVPNRPPACAPQCVSTPFVLDKQAQ